MNWRLPTQFLNPYKYMCGIIGIVATGDHSIAISEASFENMIALLQHRGPDGKGSLFKKSFFFGHRRLKITDLSDRGQQPMGDAGQEVFITYNGEIFNFQEIKVELIKKGYFFHSNSDTEVIIFAYKEWGINCIERFNGMFAFALFDARTKELFLVRDRMGIKPLYYSIVNGSLVFASELKGILHYPGFDKQINLKAVSCFLSYRYVLGNETLFKDIYQLEPGHMATYKDGKLEVSKYWDIDLKRPVINITDNYHEKFKSLIADAVAVSLAGDVEVGTLLSGGLDSSIILYLTSLNGKRPIRSFTAIFKESGYDETEFARLASKRFNSENTLVPISSKDYLSNLKNYIKYKDQPAGMHNEIATYLLAKEVKKRVSVVLSGEGADELFSGYGRIFRAPYDYKRYQIASKFPFPFERLIKKALNIKTDTQYESLCDFFIDAYSYFPWEEKVKIYNTSMKEAVEEDLYSTKIIKQCFRNCLHRNEYDQLNYFFIKMHLPGLLLMMDATTMATGLELRVPFLDHRLVEETFIMSHNEKIAWKSGIHKFVSSFLRVRYFSERCDKTKNILRQIFLNDLPEPLVSRKKMGFPAPLNEWFAGDFNNIIENEILSPDARINQVFDRSKLQDWIKSNETKNSLMLGRQLLLILNLEYWLQEYFD